MTRCIRAWICAEVRREEDGVLAVVDPLATGGEDYWATARQIANRPGTMVAVWFADNLPTEGRKAGPPSSEQVLRYIESSPPELLLLQAKWGEFFPIGGKGAYGDQVRVATWTTGP